MAHAGALLVRRELGRPRGARTLHVLRKPIALAACLGLALGAVLLLVALAEAASSARQATGRIESTT
jgi:hypothetical protein